MIHFLNLLGKIKDFYGSDFYKELMANPVIDIFDEWDENNGHNVGHDIY